LQKRLDMAALPLRIECFDNSNWSGTDPVAAMVVFVDGQPAKEFYRNYKIRFRGKPDDYAYMAEVIGRRFSKSNAESPLPDLLLVDGGKGQLNVALGILRDLHLSGKFCVAGIAKRDQNRGEHQDKIYLAGRANPVQFGRDMDLLLFLQQIRDEAHRRAIGFQRNKRQKTGMSSRLDHIPGIGPKRKSMLLKHFGGVDKIRQSALEDLTALPGISPKLARKIKSSLDTK
jgi:excinuclease ABC subunit C